MHIIISNDYQISNEIANETTFHCEDFFLNVYVKSIFVPWIWTWKIKNATRLFLMTQCLQTSRSDPENVTECLKKLSMDIPAAESFEGYQIRWVRHHAARQGTTEISRRPWHHGIWKFNFRVEMWEGKEKMQGRMSSHDTQVQPSKLDIKTHWKAGLSYPDCAMFHHSVALMRKTRNSRNISFVKPIMI